MGGSKDPGETCQRRDQTNGSGQRHCESVYFFHVMIVSQLQVTALVEGRGKCRIQMQHLFQRKRFRVAGSLPELSLKIG